LAAARGGAELQLSCGSTAETAGAAAAERPQLWPPETEETATTVGVRGQQGGSPSRSQQCSSTTTRSGAERLRQRNGEGCGAAAPMQRPGKPSPGGSRSCSALRGDSKGSRSTWSNGNTPPPGGGSARRRPPASERGGSCGEMAKAAGQLPRRSDPASLAPDSETSALAQPGEETATVSDGGRATSLEIESPIYEQRIQIL
jgi:hypothetical protein